MRIGGRKLTILEITAKAKELADLLEDCKATHKKHREIIKQLTKERDELRDERDELLFERDCIDFK